MVVAHMPSSEDNGVWHSPEDRARLIVDGGGTEWEVYDEASWSISLALEWDYLPQLENPGLIFVSRLDRRRVWPSPPNWREMDAESLLRLLGQARSIS
jgi:hypothetical protein